MPGDGDAWQRFAAPQLPRPAGGAPAAAPAPAFARSALRKGGDQPRGAAPLPRSASATTKLHERHGDTYTVASGRQTAATLALYRGVADDDPAPTPAACGAVQEATPTPEEQFQNAAAVAAGAAYRKRPSLLGLFGGAAPASGGVAVAVASTSSGTTSPVGSGQNARKGSGGRWQPLCSSTPFRPPPDGGTGSEAATPEDDRLRMRTARCTAVGPRAVARGRHEQEEPCHVVRTRQEQVESGGGGGGGGSTSTSTSGSHSSSSGGGGAGQRPRYLEHRAGYTFTIPSEPSPLTKYEGRHSMADLGDFKQRQRDSQPAPAPVPGIEDTEEMDVDKDDEENSVDLSSEQADEPSSGAGGGGGGGLTNRQGSLELDESLGILTPDQMKEPFSLLGDSAATFLCGSAPAPWAGGENSALRMDALCREVVYVDQFSFPEYDSIMDTVEEGGRAARAAASPLPPASPCSGAASASAAGDGDATEHTLSPEELPVDTPVREGAALLDDDDTKTEDASDAATLLTGILVFLI
ncbi:uncharacterized protein LOC126195777 [Schistocerca nitens]|uniref:uncharacterized protein LOC126195777 n=1 Tax=Schistocerca nitens TaxID=7011 RepID=UPI0021191BBA|nr:uncharacterized protein LOC126195777 [Schistocerca nitens]